MNFASLIKIESLSCTEEYLILESLFCTGEYPVVKVFVFFIIPPSNP